MAKKKKFPIFAIILVIGFVIVGIALIDTEFPDLIPLSLILERECNFNTIGFGEISFGDVECFLAFNRFSTDQLPFQTVTPLVGIDRNSPINLEFDFDPQSGVPLECESFVTPNVRLTLTDGVGSIIHTATEGMIVDIRPFLLPDQQTLIINFDSRGIGICPTSNILYNEIISSGLRFQQKPPEIREDTNQLLEQWLFLADFRDQQVEETSTRFAIAESFQLENPSVITDLRVRVGSALTTNQGNDFSATVTALIWNLDKTPPERIVQSFESFTGITQSRAELDLDFTFPANVVLQPTTNYGVGIRVDQNLGQQFAYTKSDQTANTHECVIDRNATTEGEVMFEPNGLCGFDISHSPVLALLLQPPTGQEGDTGSQGIQGEVGEVGETGEIGAQGTQGLQGIQGIQGESAPPLTQEELLAILCDGSASEPALCSNISQNLFQNFQIGQFSIELLLLIGIIIIILGVAGIIVRRRR